MTKKPIKNGSINKQNINPMNVQKSHWSQSNIILYYNYISKRVSNFHKNIIETIQLKKSCHYEKYLVLCEYSVHFLKYNKSQTWHLCICNPSTEFYKLIQSWTLTSLEYV